MNSSFFINSVVTLLVALLVVSNSVVAWIIPWEHALFAWGANLTPSNPEITTLVEGSRIKVLEEEHRVLQKMLRLPIFAQESLVVPVLGYELGERTHVVLGKGTQHGIAVGDAVVTPEGVFIGTILVVHESTSLMRSILDARAKFSGAIMREDMSASGVIEGVHGVGLRLSLIPRQDPLQVGDVVVTAGEEIGVPRGIPVGRVAEISETPGIPLKEAILTPLTSFHGLIALAVLKGEHTP